MKEQIEKCIEYVKQISIKEPIDFRVEEIEEYRIVLSYEERGNYKWESERLYKEFEIEKWGECGIKSMKSFPPRID
jgi:hypothetical protein